MTSIVEVLSLPDTTDRSDPLRRAVAGYLARYKGLSRDHIESDLRVYLHWCAERGLDPLAAQRPHIELYVRWMQEVRRFKPSTCHGWVLCTDGARPAARIRSGTTSSGTGS
jgi:integrase/recombinase XerD